MEEQIKALTEKARQAKFEDEPALRQLAGMLETQHDPKIVCLAMAALQEAQKTLADSSLADMTGPGGGNLFSEVGPGVIDRLANGSLADRTLVERSLEFLGEILDDSSLQDDQSGARFILVLGRIVRQFSSSRPIMQRLCYLTAWNGAGWFTEGASGGLTRLLAQAYAHELRAGNVAVLEPLGRALRNCTCNDTSDDAEQVAQSGLIGALAEACQKNDQALADDLGECLYALVCLRGLGDALAAARLLGLFGMAAGAVNRQPSGPALNYFDDAVCRVLERGSSPGDGDGTGTGTGNGNGNGNGNGLSEAEQPSQSLYEQAQAALTDAFVERCLARIRRDSAWVGMDGLLLYLRHAPSVNRRALRELEALETVRRVSGDEFVGTGGVDRAVLKETLEKAIEDALAAN